MEHFGIRELRNNISQYGQKAEAGQITVISKNGCPLTVNIPFDDTLLKLGAHRSLAVKFYQEEVLTLVKAAKLACLPIDDFIALLGALHISVLGYDSDELLEELG